MEFGGCETHPRIWDGHWGLGKQEDLSHVTTQMHWEEMDMGDTHCGPGGCVPNVQRHAWRGAGGALIWSNLFNRVFGRISAAHCTPLFLQELL